MKVFITLSALLVVALAAPVEEYGHQQQYQSTSPIPILKYDSKNGHDGSYAFAYETGNGINAHEQGFVKNAGSKDGEIQVAQGYYTYTGEDGKQVQVHYQADENGFQAQGDHFPTPVPLPKEHQKIWDEALAQIAAQPHEQQEHNKYQYVHEEPKYQQAQPAPKQYEQHYEQPQQHYEQPQQHYEAEASQEYQPQYAQYKKQY